MGSRNSSIITRVVLLSIVWIAIALLATALLLGRFYREHIQQHYDAHITTHLEELIAATRAAESVGTDAPITLTRQPTDPHFHATASGWYWEIRHGDTSLLRSPSLSDTSLPFDPLTVDEASGIAQFGGPLGEPLRARVSQVSVPFEPGLLTFIATAPEMSISDDVVDFNQHILVSFLVLGLGLAAAVIVQVVLALKPLKAVQSGIADVQSGKAARVQGDFPRDLRPLVDELNFLLDHNEVLLRRARNQLGDLAHAVKNPLTVIRNEARGMANRQGQVILDQSHVMANSIDHCLSRARMHGQRDAMGYRTSVREVLEDLTFAMEHIYRDRELHIDVSQVHNCWFRGEAQDLEEMVGNLLDNACKWAESTVSVGCYSEDRRLFIVVNDDGPGIPSAERAEVLKRGHRLDESKKGHGHGLSIVRDICALYDGQLMLDRSDLGGLRARLELPAPSNDRGS